ncbi:MAG: PH domain-containing protein [Candidatus Nanopelagicales bacterium]
MSADPPRPVFGFLWPKRPAGPLDGDARQERWLRATPRGPWRLAFLVAVTLTLLSLAAPAALALLAAPSAYAVAVVLLVAIPAVALTARGWAAGTYVNDSGLKVSSVLRTHFAPWSAIALVRAERQGVRWLGTPLRIPGEVLIVEVIAADPVSTTVSTASPDLWLRPHAWEAARDALTQWWRESRSA